MTTKYKVLIFEDATADARRLQEALALEDCEVRHVGNARCEALGDLIAEFGPDFCIVDCKFDFQTDGLEVIKALHKARRGLPVVVCSQLLDEPNERKLVIRKYRNLPGVRALVGKKPFPTGVELLRRAGFARGEDR